MILIKDFFLKGSGMETKEYHKLVRDAVPDIIRRNGDVCDIEILSEDAYQQALRDKLREEAQEVATAEGDALVTELADLYEVIDALMGSYGISAESVHARQQQKRIQRGGFEQRILLVRTHHNTKE